MGMPFYGRPSKDYKGQRPFGKLSIDGLYSERWDSIALVPYLVDAQGNMVLAHENATSINHKCNYILAKVFVALCIGIVMTMTIPSLSAARSGTF